MSPLALGNQGPCPGHYSLEDLILILLLLHSHHRARGPGGQEPVSIQNLQPPLLELSSHTLNPWTSCVNSPKLASRLFPWGYPPENWSCLNNKLSVWQNSTSKYFQQRVDRNNVSGSIISLICLERPYIRKEWGLDLHRKEGGFWVTAFRVCIYFWEE